MPKAQVESIIYFNHSMVMHWQTLLTVRSTVPTRCKCYTFCEFGLNYFNCTWLEGL